MFFKIAINTNHKLFDFWDPSSKPPSTQTYLTFQALFEGIIERDEAGAVEGIGSEKEEDAEVFVGVGAGDGEVLGIHASILPRGSDIHGPTRKK